MANNKLNRKFIIVLIAIVVALIHFVTGRSYNGPFPIFVNGYLIDILLPFAMFLVLKTAKLKILKNDLSIGFFVFLIGATSETLQYFGVPIFGRTFDPLDYLMFITGIVMAHFFHKVYLINFPLN